MTEEAHTPSAPTSQMWTTPPGGTYLPRLALLDWTRVLEPTLTTFPDGAALLEGYVTEPLGPPTPNGYECVAEAVGWRWRFRGVVEMPPMIELEDRQVRVPVVVRSIGPVISEAAPSGQALQA